MKSFILWTGSVLGILAVFFWLFIYIGWFPNYSDGQRTGELYKFSKKGIIYKSWEGSLYLGGVHSSGGDNPTLQLDRFDFSIPASQEEEKVELIAKIKKCAELRKVCTIEYKQWLKSPIYQDSRYTVVGVKN